LMPHRWRSSRTDWTFRGQQRVGQ